MSFLLKILFLYVCKWFTITDYYPMSVGLLPIKIVALNKINHTTTNCESPLKRARAYTNQPKLIAKCWQS